MENGRVTQHLPWISLEGGGDDRSASQVPGHHAGSAARESQDTVDKWEESDFIFGAAHSKMSGVGGSSSYVGSFSSFGSAGGNTEDDKTSSHALGDSVDGHDSQFGSEDDEDGRGREGRGKEGANRGHKNHHFRSRVVNGTQSGERRVEIELSDGSKNGAELRHHLAGDSEYSKHSHEYSPKGSVSNESDHESGSAPAPMTQFLSSWRNLFRSTEQDKPKGNHGPSVDEDEENDVEEEDWDLDEEDWDLEMYPEHVADGEEPLKARDREAPERDVGRSGLFSSNNSRKRSSKPKQFSKFKSESLLDFLEAPRPVATKRPDAAAMHAPCLYTIAVHGAAVEQATSGVPHAPSSEHGFIAWIEGLAAKVETTIALYERAAPGDEVNEERRATGFGSRAIPVHSPALRGRRRGLAEDLNFASAISRGEALYYQQRYTESVALLQEILMELEEACGRNSVATNADATAQGDSKARSDADAFIVKTAAALLLLLGKLVERNPQCLAANDVLELINTNSRLTTTLTTFEARIQLRLHLHEMLSHLELTGWDQGDLEQIMSVSFLDSLGGIANDCATRDSRSQVTEDKSGLKDVLARALADVQLHVLGFSALTCEYFPPRRRARCKQKSCSIFEGSRLSLEQRLGLLIPQLAPNSFNRAKAALALGLVCLRGSPADGLGLDDQIQIPTGRQSPASFVTKHRLALSESCFFESACIIAQAVSEEPVDLPKCVTKYWRGLGAVRGMQVNTFSLLVSSIGATTLHAFATALNMRHKHMYSMPILEVCMGIAQVRRKRSEQNHLVRELCLLCVRHGKPRQGLILLDQTLVVAQANMDVNEVHFLTKVQVALHLDAGDHDGAKRCLESAIKFIEDIRTGEKVLILECAAALEVLLILKAQVNLAAIDPFGAIADLQRILKTSKTRQVREQTFGLLARTFLKLRDFERCRQSLAHLERYRISLGRPIVPPPRPPRFPRLPSTVQSQSITGGIYGKPTMLQFATKVDNLDMADIVARNFYHHGQIVFALRVLAPAVEYVETIVKRMKGIKGPILHELGRLYYLRGKIQHAASSAVRPIKFPVHVLPARFHHSSVGIRELHLGADAKVNQRHYRHFSNSHEIMMDAEQWYRRAWKCFDRVGNEHKISKVTTALARLHLDNVFVQTVVLKTPLATAQPYQREARHAAGSLKRTIALGDTEQASVFALNIAVDTCMPLVLIEAYLNMAELHLMKNGSFEAKPFWWEARDLFLHLLVDGASIPLARMAFPGTLEHIHRILGRLVRFLAVCERPLVNQNLLLFDVLVLFEHDRDRTLVRQQGRLNELTEIIPQLTPGLVGNATVVQRACGVLSNRKKIPNILNREESSNSIDSVSSASNTQETSTITPSLFSFPDYQERSDSAKKRAQMAQRGPFTLRSLAMLFQQDDSAKARAKLDGGIDSVPSSRRWRKARGDKKAGEPLPLGAKTDPRKRVTDVFFALSNRTHESTDVESLSEAMRVPRSNSASNLRSLDLRGKTLPSRPQQNRQTSVIDVFGVGSVSTSAEDVDSSFASFRAEGFQGLLLFPVSLEQEVLPSKFLHSLGQSHLPRSDEDAVMYIIECMAVLRRVIVKYNLSQTSLGDMKVKNRESLKRLSLGMTKLRAASRQPVAADVTFDELLHKSEYKAAQRDQPRQECESWATTGKRLMGLVYALQVQGLLFFYFPKTGRRLLRALGSGTPIMSYSSIESGGRLSLIQTRDRITSEESESWESAQRKDLTALSQVFTALVSDDYRWVSSAVSEARLSHRFEPLRSLFRGKLSESIQDRDFGDGHVDNSVEKKLDDEDVQTPRDNFPNEILDPFVLICSKDINAVPWESIVGADVYIIRALCVLSLMSTRFPSAGHRRHAPMTMAFTLGKLGRDYRAFERRRKRRLAAGAVQSVVPTSTAPFTPASGRTAPSPSSARDHWPFQSPLLPHGRTTPSALAHWSVRQIAFFDVSAGDIIEWLERQPTRHTRQTPAPHTVNLFPVFLLSFSDLCVMSEGALSLMGIRPDCALVFTAASSMGYLSRELAIVREYIINSAASDSAEQGSSPPSAPAADTEPHEVLRRVVNAVRTKHRSPIIVYGS